MVVLVDYTRSRQSKLSGTWYSSLHTVYALCNCVLLRGKRYEDMAILKVIHSDNSVNTTLPGMISTRTPLGRLNIPTPLFYCAHRDH